MERNETGEVSGDAPGKEGRGGARDHLEFIMVRKHATRKRDKQRTPTGTGTEEGGEGSRRGDCFCCILSLHTVDRRSPLKCSAGLSSRARRRICFPPREKQSRARARVSAACTPRATGGWKRGRNVKTSAVKMGRAPEPVSPRPKV